MKLDTALTHFKTTRAGLARILSLDSTTVGKWGGAIPLDKAALLNKLSFGALAIDWSLYDERGKPRKDAT